MRSILMLLALVVFISCQKPPTTEQIVDNLIEVRFDKTIFTAFAWLNIGKYEPEDTTAMEEIGKRVYSMVFKKLNPVQLEAIKKQYRAYAVEYDRMIEYITVIFAINCTQPPEIIPLYDELKEYGDSTGKPDKWSLSRIKELEPLAVELTNFFQIVDMEHILRTVQPVYDSIGAVYRSQAVMKISDAIAFTGIHPDDISHIKKIVIIPELQSFPGEMGPEYKGIKYDIKGPKSEVVFYTHEFLHSIVHPLLQESGVKEKVTRLIESKIDSIKNTKAWESYSEPMIFFEECLVRALDAHIMNMNIEDAPKKIQAELAYEESRGFVFCHEISQSLHNFDSTKSTLNQIISQFI